MIVQEIFRLPDSFTFVQIPTDEDERGYVEVPAMVNEFHWGAASMLVSDIAEFANHISFALGHKYSVTISPLRKQGAITGYSVIAIDSDAILVLNKVFTTRKDLYLGLKGIYGAKERIE